MAHNNILAFVFFMCTYGSTEWRHRYTYDLTDVTIRLHFQPLTVRNHISLLEPQKGLHGYVYILSYSACLISIQGPKRINLFILNLYIKNIIFMRYTFMILTIQKTVTYYCFRLHNHRDYGKECAVRRVSIKVLPMEYIN